MKKDGRHNNMVDLVTGVLLSQNFKLDKNRVYRLGELDVLCNHIYYEVKSSFNKRNVLKAMDQVDRAMRNHGEVEYGYLVTPDGVYDIMGEYVVKL